MKIESREYKLLVDHTPFRQPAEAAKAMWEYVRLAAKHLPLVQIKGRLDESPTTTVHFLDTPDFTLRRNGLLLRQRSGQDASEWTLKCRSEDLFMAAGTDVRPSKKFKSTTKFEEDIAPPFLCRFSHSARIDSTEIGKSGKFPDAPETIESAEEIFPVIGTLLADDRPLHRKVELRTVQGIVAKETVWKSDTIAFRTDEDDRPIKASFAIIVWSRGRSDVPVIAELSFRIKTIDGELSRIAAVAARSLYKALLSCDFYRADARTKTEYVYRDGGRD